MTRSLRLSPLAGSELFISTVLIIGIWRSDDLALSNIGDVKLRETSTCTLHWHHVDPRDATLYTN